MNKKTITLNIQNLIGTLIIVDGNAPETIEKTITEALTKALKIIHVEGVSLQDQCQETHE